MASAPPQSEPDAPAPPKSKKKKHRQLITSTKRGIKKQAKEDIRYLKWEQKEASRQKKRGGETDKNTEKNGSPETKGGRKTGSFRKAGCKKRAEKKGGFQGGHLICHVKTRFPEKAKERPDLGGLSSGGKNRKRNRLYHRRTVREDPGD